PVPPAPSRRRPAWVTRAGGGTKMFGLSFGEVLVILVVALLVLGPARLPSLARTIGKTLRDFRRATTDIRSSMEDEFYRMDQPHRPVATSTTSSAPPAVEPRSGPAAEPPPSADDKVKGEG